MAELLLHESVGLGLLGGLWVALATRAGLLSPMALEVAAGAGLYALGLWILRDHRKARLVLAYALSLWLYTGTARFTPALHFGLKDELLLGWDRALFGETPAARLEAWSTPALTELFSACYASYQLYLHAALLWALKGPADEAEALGERVFTALLAGYLGYLVVPALGPGPAFPTLFHGDLPGDGVLRHLSEAMVARGGGVYDAFPSLHVALTLVVLAWDRTRHPWRFRLMLPVSVGLVLSTLYLRAHYAVDLVAGAVLAAAFARRGPAK